MTRPFASSPSPSVPCSDHACSFATRSPARPARSLAPHRVADRLVFSRQTFGRSAPDTIGELWGTDGSTLGTERIARFDGFQLALLGARASTIFFTLEATDGAELWRATLGGDVSRLLSAPQIRAFTAIGSETEADTPATASRPFFPFFTGGAGSTKELWVSDGTQAGTERLLTIEAPDLAVAWLGPRLLFRAEGTLWTTDGTVAGTESLEVPIPSEALRESLRFGPLLVFSGGNDNDVELWSTDDTGDGTHRSLDLTEGPEGSFPHDLVHAGGRLYFSATTPTSGRELWSVPIAALAPEALLLRTSDRFDVRVSWTKPNGDSGFATPNRLTADTGLFWFFRDSNVELMLKILDGRASNGHFWVFYGALSNVAYTISVTDRETGAVRVYDNLPGAFASVGDTRAFAESGSEPSSESVMIDPSTVLHRALDSLAALGTSSIPPSVELRSNSGAGCTTTTEALCLQQSRFRLSVE